jgi:hypothetical protein
MFVLSFSWCVETPCEEVVQLLLVQDILVCPTCRTEDQFVVTVSSGIRDRDTRVVEIDVYRLTFSLTTFR